MADNVKDITVPTEPKDARVFVNSQKFAQAVDAAIPRGLSGARLLRQMQTAVNRNEQLSKCSVVSLRDCFMDIAQLGLDLTPALGQAYLVPYGQNCTLIVGYRGLIELMYRSGKVKSVRAVPVFKGDKFSYTYGLNESLVHEPCGNTSPDDLTHVYCIVKLEGVDPVWQVMTVDQVDRIKARSRSSKNGPWVTDYVPMALKTVVRQTAKWCPMMAEAHDSMAREDSQATPDYIEVPFEHVSPAEASAPAAIAGRLANRQGGKKAAAAPPAQQEASPASQAPAAAPAPAPQEDPPATEEEPKEEWVPEGEEPAAEEGASEGKISEAEFKAMLIKDIEAKVATLKAAGRLVFTQQVNLAKKPLTDRTVQELDQIVQIVERCGKGGGAGGK